MDMVLGVKVSLLMLIPNEVKEAFLELKEVYSGMVREANPLYASVN